MKNNIKRDNIYYIKTKSLFWYKENYKNREKAPLYLVLIQFRRIKNHRYLLDVEEIKDNFLGTIAKLEDLNKKASNSAFNNIVVY